MTAREEFANNAKKIAKHCASIKAAERYQNRLYAQYEQVRLAKSPRFTEDGEYIWLVA